MNVCLLMSTGSIFAADVAKSATDLGKSIVDSAAGGFSYVGDIKLDITTNIQKLKLDTSCYKQVRTKLIVGDNSTGQVIHGTCEQTTGQQAGMGTTGDRLTIDTSQLQKTNFGKVAEATSAELFTLPGVNTAGKLFSFIPLNPVLTYLRGAEAQIVVQTLPLTTELAAKEGKEWAADQVLVKFLIRTETNPDKQQQGTKVFTEIANTVLSKANATKRSVEFVANQAGEAFFKFFPSEEQTLTIKTDVLQIPR